MTYDNEAIVRNAYHTAEGNVLDIPGWIGSFTSHCLSANGIARTTRGSTPGAHHHCGE